VSVAVFFVVLDTGSTLAGASWWPAHPGTLAWVMLALQAAASFSLVAYRRAPFLVIGILAAFTLALTLLIDPAGALTPAQTGNVYAPWATVLAAYGPFFDGKDRRKALLAIVVLAVIVARPWQPSLTVILIGSFRTAFGPLVAMYLDARRRLIQALTERAERAERERLLLAEQARAEERARLAGEMHDVVTHRVSLMVLQAGALQVTATDDRTRQAADELRAAGCQALEELRDLVGVLRTPPAADQAPQTWGFGELVAESTAVGTPVELTEEGDPALASPVVGRTAYRIVREALTNVRKHAPGARVTVRVSYDEIEVRLAVRNGPPALEPAALEPASAAARLAGSSLAGTGSGLGIASLRQRVDVVHGTLSAGRTEDGGFCLEATLPAYVPTGESAGEP